MRITIAVLNGLALALVDCFALAFIYGLAFTLVHWCFLDLVENRVDNVKVRVVHKSLQICAGEALRVGCQLVIVDRRRDMELVCE